MASNSPLVMEDLKQQFLFAENLINRVLKENIDQWEYKTFYNSHRKCEYFTFAINSLVRHLSKTYLYDVALDCANANGFEDKKFLHGVFIYFLTEDFEPYQFLLMCVFVGSYVSVLEMYNQTGFAFYACKIISSLICQYMQNGEFTEDAWNLLTVAAIAYAEESEEHRVHMLKNSDIFRYLKTVNDVPVLHDLQPKHSYNLRTG